jgi:hypothetical protein
VKMVGPESFESRGPSAPPRPALHRIERETRSTSDISLKVFSP